MTAEVPTDQPAEQALGRIEGEGRGVPELSGMSLDGRLLSPRTDSQADKVPVKREARLRGGSPGGDIKLEHIAVTALPNVCRLLGNRRGERDRGTTGVGRSTAPAPLP